MLLSRNVSRLLRARDAMAAFWLMCMLNLRCLSMVRPRTLFVLLIGMGTGFGKFGYSDICRGAADFC